MAVLIIRERINNCFTFQALMANLVKNSAMDLFANPNEIQLDMLDAEVYYYPDFLDKKLSDSLLKLLLDGTPWQQDDITVFGKTYPQPRLTALYGENARTYTYSNITMHPNEFTNELIEIKNRVEKSTKYIFTTCLLNLYRDGNDSNGWHSDDEKELGTNPIIASLSLGAERIFHFKHKSLTHLKQKLVLHHGSLLLMSGKTQHNWLHQLPKTKKKIGKRINLTFRNIA